MKITHRKIKFATFLPLIACGMGFSTASGATLAQAAGNGPQWFQAQVLDTGFSAEFNANIENSGLPLREHVTLLGMGTGAYHWYQFTHSVLGGDVIIDIDDSTVGASPTASMSIAVYYWDDVQSKFIMTTGSGQLDPGSTNSDPYIKLVNSHATNFWVGVAGAGATFTNLGLLGLPGVFGPALSAGSDYNLNVTIPEPSAALLGAFGMLAILKRRR